jgi:hypothetical protein
LSTESASVVDIGDAWLADGGIACGNEAMTVAVASTNEALKAGMDDERK